jgi:hypothetical protein
MLWFHADAAACAALCGCSAAGAHGLPLSLLLLQARAVKDGLTFVAPYDDPHTIAGQGTIGDEILRQVSALMIRGFMVRLGVHCHL